MDRTSWKPKVFEATENVDYKVNEGIEQFNLKEIVGLYEVSTVMLPTAFNDLKMYETMIIKNNEFMEYKKTYRTEEEARIGHQETIMKVQQNEINESKASEGYTCDKCGRVFDDPQSQAEHPHNDTEWYKGERNTMDAGFNSSDWARDYPYRSYGIYGSAESNENWKDVADKFYKEEINKGKKIGGESSMNCTKCQTRVWDKNGGMMNGSYNEELDGNSYTVCGNCGDKYKLRTFESKASESGLSYVEDSILENPMLADNSFNATVQCPICNIMINDPWSKTMNNPHNFDFGDVNDFLFGALLDHFKDQHSMNDEQAYHRAMQTMGMESKASEMSASEWENKIEKLSNRKGVKKIAVQNFLMTVGSNPDYMSASMNAEMDSGMYGWNYATQGAIHEGISIFFKQVKSGEGLIDNIEKELLKFGINLDKDPDQVKESKVKASEMFEHKLMDISNNGWDFSVIGVGGGGDGSFEVGIFKQGDFGTNQVKPHLSWIEVESLQRIFEFDPVMAFREIGGKRQGGKWSESKEAKLKANEEGVNDWWDRVTTDGSDLDRMWRGTHFNEIPIEHQNHYFSLYMEELSADKYGDHMAMHNATDFSHPSMYKYDADLADPNKTDNMPYYGGWQVEDSLHSGNTTNPFAIQNDTTSTDDLSVDDDPFNVKASEYTDPFYRLIEYIHDNPQGVTPEELERKFGDNFSMDKINQYVYYDGKLITHRGYADDIDGYESLTNEGFNQGLHGYVDAKCKTCGGLEFDSIPDMNDHFAMNSDHISNLDDLDNDIPNRD